MNAPAGVQIGARWIAKRGRRVSDLSIRQIHRADRAVTAIDQDGNRVIVPWRELRKTRKPETIQSRKTTT